MHDRQTRFDKAIALVEDMTMRAAIVASFHDACNRDPELYGDTVDCLVGDLEVAVGLVKPFGPTEREMARGVATYCNYWEIETSA